MAQIVKGGSWLVSRGGVLVACLQQCDMNSTRDKQDVSCKNPEGNKSYEPGAKETTFSMQGVLVRPEAGDPAEVQAPDLWDDWNDGVTSTFRIGDVISGGEYWEGEGQVFNFSVSAGNVGTLVTFTCEITLSGEVTKGTTP